MESNLEYYQNRMRSRAAGDRIKKLIMREKLKETLERSNEIKIKRKK